MNVSDKLGKGVLGLGKQGLVVAQVFQGSIGDELGIEVGDKILSIDGMLLQDIIDYKYLTSDEFLLVKVQSNSGEVYEAEIEKEFDEDLGLAFESYTADGIKRCGNKCIFCFVDQMAPQMRDSLYVKDDDYRWSFLQGNFVTLTNLKNEDLARILKLRLSPLYISVHTTNPELRAKMLNNPKAKEINNILHKLKDTDLEFHAQVVLCPGVNDGVELDKTISDLTALWPNALSLAIVPVGLTKFRQGLFQIRKFTKEEAKVVIQQVEKHQRACQKEFSKSFVYLSDEFYLIAEEPIPSREKYDDFPQIENGVGTARIFIDEFTNLEPDLPGEIKNKDGKDSKKQLVITLATGVSGSKVLMPIVDRLNQIKGLKVQLKVIPNHFFGNDVTVTGLLTGIDLIKELKGQDLGEALLIPRVMLKSGETVFLDNCTVDDIQSQLGYPVIIVEDSAESMVRKIIEMEVAKNG